MEVEQEVDNPMNNTEQNTQDNEEFYDIPSIDESINEDAKDINDPAVQQSLKAIEKIEYNIRKLDYNLERYANRYTNLWLQLFIALWRSRACHKDFITPLKTTIGSYAYESGMIGENATRELLSLDAIESNGSSTVRQTRKNLVHRIELLINSSTILHNKGKEMKDFLQKSLDFINSRYVDKVTKPSNKPFPELQSMMKNSSTTPISKVPIQTTSNPENVFNTNQSKKHNKNKKGKSRKIPISGPKPKETPSSEETKVPTMNEQKLNNIDCQDNAMNNNKSSVPEISQVPKVSKINEVPKVSQVSKVNEIPQMNESTSLKNDNEMDGDKDEITSEEKLEPQKSETKQIHIPVMDHNKISSKNVSSSTSETKSTSNEDDDNDTVNSNQQDTEEYTYLHPHPSSSPIPTKDDDDEEDDKEEEQYNYKPQYKWVQKGNKAYLLIQIPNADNESIRILNKNNDILIKGTRYVYDSNDTPYRRFFSVYQPQYIPKDFFSKIPIENHMTLSKPLDASYSDDILTIQFTILSIKKPKNIKQTSPYSHRTPYTSQAYPSYQYNDDDDDDDNDDDNNQYDNSFYKNPYQRPSMKSTTRNNHYFDNSNQDEDNDDEYYDQNPFANYNSPYAQSRRPYRQNYSYDNPNLFNPRRYDTYDDNDNYNNYRQSNRNRSSPFSSGMPFFSGMPYF